MSTRVNIPIDVKKGLNLFDPQSSLGEGELVKADNLRAGAWGPRHGNTFVDKTARTRGNVDLNGSTAFVTLPYVAEQFALGTEFALDVLVKIGALPSVNPAWLFGTDHASSRVLDLSLGTGGVFTAYLKDADANVATLTSSVAKSATDIVHVRVYRSGDTSRLYVDRVLEDADTGLGAESPMVVLAEDRLVGRTSLSSPTTEFFDGILGYVLLRSFPDTNFNYAYSELPGPRGPEVLGAWMGELLTVAAANDTIFDASRFGNHGIVSNGYVTGTGTTSSPWEGCSTQ
jgi:hypothetical protein